MLIVKKYKRGLVLKRFEVDNMKVQYLIVMSFLLAACSSEPGLNTESPFLGGSNSLGIAFLEGEPPSETYDSGQSSFDITLEIENLGEYYVPMAETQFKLRGLEAAAFGVDSTAFTKSVEANLEEAKKDPDTGEVILGTFTTLSFSGLNYLDSLAGNRNFEFIIDACYNYGTDVISDLCIKEDNLDSDDTVCSNRGAKVVYSSASPIQIVSLRQSPVSEDTIGFSFTVKHIGSGDVFSKDSLCDEDNINANEKVYVSVNSGIEGDLFCNGLSEGTHGLVRLQSGEKIIRCQQQIAQPGDFIKPIDISLEFAYETTLQNNILVKSLT
jgi:hypothetical protein